MASFNEVQLVRAFARFTTPPGTQESHVPNGNKFDIVVAAEAGTAIGGMAAPYRVIVVLRDLSAGAAVAGPPPITGTLGDANWPGPNYAAQLVFAFPGQPAAKKDHIYQAITVVVVGAVNPIVDFSESDLFVIT